MIARAVAAALMVVAAPAADAEPYRLRGDALATAQSPAGLVVLQADGKEGPFVAAEALLWLGAGQEEEAQALVAAVRARRPSGAAEARIGRMVVTAGGLRPVHLDGASGRLRLPRRFALEAFAGSPVAPGLEGRSWDWLAGGRASRSLGHWGSTGIAYLHRRDSGRLSDEEVAFDASGAATEWLDLSAKTAVDLIQFGVSEAQATASGRAGAWRLELYGVTRSPSRILPATSLFSVLGDQPSHRVGATARWRAAPRLDLFADAGALSAGDEWGELAAGRAQLRLDDRGTGALGAELRREAAPGGGWTGARATARTPPIAGYRAALEGELARPDGGDQLWPWGLLALSRAFGDWEAAAAVEASSSPEEVYRVDAIGRMTWIWSR